MRRTTHRREKQQPDETGGFRFAVTLLVALGTILYVTQNYLQTTPVDPFLYVFACGLTLIALILVIGLLLYILFKGYSLEVQNSNQRKSLEKWSAHIYLAVFLVFTLLLVVVLFALILTFIFVSGYLKVSYKGFIIFAAVFGITIGIILILTVLKNNQWRSVLFIGTFCIAFILLWPTLFSAVLYSPLQGHVTVDMESVYYKNDAPIPVLIHVTGPNTGLSIQLFQENSNHNLSLNDSITLSPERNQSKTVSGENSTLVGNALDYGTYNVFINTTNLSAGYYELVCKRQKYEKTYGARGFYLVNSSRHSIIEE